MQLSGAMLDLELLYFRSMDAPERHTGYSSQVVVLCKNKK